jgi:ERCC4-related helicase
MGISSWETIGNKGFDCADLFSAYLHSLRWNCVTSTEAKLFQAPYRAGIEVKAYQLEPLRKALLMPRVALFIADDVGLGKTIEAGLIIREMIMRQKVRKIIIACPPSVVRQWQQEMENRFGLTFMIFDRDFMADRRQERGYKVNPWTTHTRFIISHALLRDENYASPLRDWLGDFNAGAMLILDEAHNVAPASGAKYAVDSHLTRTMRDLAPRFEHKLFLSATPHNGHSNSFASLLEMLDPQRFCRGVPVKEQKLLDAVMVRRLKRDLREIGDDFPQREVIPLIIDNLASDAPELVLSALLQEYRLLRETRLKQESKTKQAAGMLVLTSLQKRLLSSIDAFARTLKVHHSAIEKQVKKQSRLDLERFNLLQESTNGDDDRSLLSEAEIETEENAQMSIASMQINEGISQGELELLAKMADVANQARYEVDPRLKLLIQWIKTNLCPTLGEDNAPWLERRVLIFTEYTDTKRYLQQHLEDAIAKTHLAQERIGTFHGGISEETRELIKTAFNTDPKVHPLRILIATDAAREGVNLQNHCADLFHFDIPWNPSRMEQRNGRIDRKLQRSPIVRCYYFVLPQRVEDRVLDVLVQKTRTIQQELGSLSPVVEKNINLILANGIRNQEIEQLNQQITKIEEDQENPSNSEVIKTELEVIRQSKIDLSKQVNELQELLHKSRQWLGLSDLHFREALGASLQMLGVSALQPLDSQEVITNPETARWEIPALNERIGADPNWLNTLDTLRKPRQKGQKLWEWRKEAPLRPVVFRDPGTLDGEVVHLHLEHRIVQRLLGRFLAQGFVHHELTRACVCLTDDPLPKVIALGRLSLYGQGASRLHDEVIAIAAQWLTPETRGKKKLKPLGESEKEDVLELLETSLVNNRLKNVSETVKERLLTSIAEDISQLTPYLEKRAEILTQRAIIKLQQRGEKEALEMAKILESQKKRILERQQETKTIQLSLNIYPELEQNQVKSDLRYWEQRLLSLTEEIETEPKRIKQIYEVKASRIEPVGLVYLYPVSG